ncbi:MULTISPECIES: hypothetical protein [Bacteria]|uniref:hypothetical protein n=1 Tax=Bacteria TaxID=2 RepID=UPI003C7A99FC
MTVNEETPAGQGEGFEVTVNTSEEQKMNGTTIDGVDVREPIRPIYGPRSDPGRWAELAAWFESNADRLVEPDGVPWATLEELGPSERAEWHVHRVLGRRDSIYTHGVVYPEFPACPAPWWATSEEDRDVQVPAEHPVRAFVRELPGAHETSIEQEAIYDPEAGSVRWSDTSLSVWIDDEVQVRFTDAADAVTLARALLRGAAALRRVNGEEVA